MDYELTNEQLNDSDEISYKVEDINNCALCATPLNFRHEFDYLNLTVQENAHCPACRIQLKTRTFTLQ